MSTNEELEARILRLELKCNELSHAHNGLRGVVGGLLNGMSKLSCDEDDGK